VNIKPTGIPPAGFPVWEIIKKENRRVLQKEAAGTIAQQIRKNVEQGRGKALFKK